MLKDNDSKLKDDIKDIQDSREVLTTADFFKFTTINELIVTIDT